MKLQNVSVTSNTC